MDHKACIEWLTVYARWQRTEDTCRSKNVDIFWWLYLKLAKDSDRIRRPRPCPLGCSSRSASWCVGPEAESTCLPILIGSIAPSGETQLCPLRREANSAVISQFKKQRWLQSSTIYYLDDIQIRKDTYRRIACFRGPACSPVCTCTCSFLWCSGIRHSYRSQARGTRWCLRKRQEETTNFCKLIRMWDWECYISRDYRVLLLAEKSMKKGKVRKYCNGSPHQNVQLLNGDKIWNNEVSQVYESRVEWWHKGNIHIIFDHCKPE